MDKFGQVFNPVTKSTWYQKNFGFDDGTKVYTATSAITNPTEYEHMHLAEPHVYDSPATTFGKVLYGDATDETWYANLSIPQSRVDGSSSEIVTGALLVLIDENGKKLKAKNLNGNSIYPASGISLSDGHSLTRLFSSTFFKGSQWKCKSMVQVASIRFKRATVAGTNDTVLVPEFKLRTVGTIIIQKYKYVTPEGVVPIDKRLALMEAALFNGLGAPPSKKRKRTNIIKNKTPGTKIEFDTETLSDSSVEGEE